MKKLFLFLLVISCFTVKAQVYSAQSIYGVQYKRLKIDSTLHIPTFCGVPTLRNSVIGNQSAIAFDSCNNILYKYDPKYETWSPIGTGSYIQDGLISGGIVTWSGSGLKFYVSPATYVISSIYYHSGLDSVTLATAPTSDSRIDLIGVDTTGHAFATTGTASATPIVPQADLTSQIALTTGILLNAGDTVPSNVTTTVIYDEDLQHPYEWDTSRYGAISVVDFANTDKPKNGTKDMLISSYHTNTTIVFSTTSFETLTQDQTVSLWVYLNGYFKSSIYALLYNSTTKAITNWIPISSLINKFDSTKYQKISFNTSDFTWTGENQGKFNTIEFRLVGSDTIGTKGLYIDWVTLQKGINSIPPQTDYSNKLDSVLLRNDSLFQYIKGVKTFKGLASGSGTGNTKYVHEGWGIKIDSSGNNYTVAVDSTLLKDSIYAGRGITVDTTTYPNRTLLVVDSNYVRDTSLHLDGGTISQVLKKNSSTNGDWSWQDESGGTTIDTTSLSNRIDAKQATLVSGTNIKTINGNSLLGSGDLTISAGVTQSVISDTLKNYANSGSITTPNVLFSTPLTLSVSNHQLTGTLTLNTQSARRLFGTGSSSGTPSFLSSIDSNYVTGLHTEAYYNTKYAAYGSGSLPSGNNGSIQYKKNGIFASDTSFTWNDTTKRANFGGFYLGNFYNTGDAGIMSSSAYGIIIGGKTGSSADIALMTGTSGLVRLSILADGTVNIPGNLKMSSSGFVYGPSAYNAFTFTSNTGGFGYVSSTNGSFPAFEANAIGILSGPSANLPIYLAGSKINFEIGAGSSTKVAQFAPTTGNLMLQNGGTFTDVTNALFQVASTTKGSIPAPKMTTTQRTAIASPPEGLQVYDTDLHKLYVYDGTSWVAAW